jgi:hypothetical protein
VPVAVHPPGRVDLPAVYDGFNPGSALPGTVDAAVPYAVTASGPAVPDSAIAYRAPEELGWIAVFGRADAAETAAPAAIDPGNEMHTRGHERTPYPSPWRHRLRPRSHGKTISPDAYARWQCAEQF